MSPDRAAIAHLITSLDHPDGIRQREVMDQLLGLLQDPYLGDDVLDTALANLRVIEPPARTALIRVLSEYAHPKSLLPLMRYTFDSRGKIADSDARGLAMQAIMRIATEEHADKLFGFLMDMKSDDDPFVRGYAAEAFAQFNDPRAKHILMGMLESDPHEFVKERVTRALKKLEAAPSTQGSGALAQHNISGTELLQNIRGTQGSDRNYWLSILRERPDSFELLKELITQGGSKGTLIGLRELLEHPDPAARALVVSHLSIQRDSAEHAIGLRILAKHLQGDANPQELQLIQNSLRNTDHFVQRAALKAATASGNPDMLERALAKLDSRDEMTRSEVAAALPQAGGDALRKHAPKLRSILKKAHEARLHSASDDVELIEANLLQALSTFAADMPVGKRDMQRDALRSLHKSSARWPVLVSALKLLREATSEEPLSEDLRWSEAESAPLLDLLSHENDKVKQRALEFLRHGAPLKWQLLTNYVEPLLHDPEAPVIEHLIPLLEQATGTRAEQLLEDLALSSREDVADAARNALQRMRNTQRVVEASFVTPDEFF